MDKKIVEPEREIPVAMNVDVLVAGGGPAGIGAALGAARNGVDTLLVERYGFLGGMATAGLVNPFDEAAGKGGAVQRFFDRLKALGCWVPRNFDPETFKYVAFELMEEEGVKLLLHSFVVDAIVEDNVVKGVIVENKSGRQALLAKRTIDCTGDGDVAAHAGASYEKGREEDRLMQPVSLMFRLANVGEFPDMFKYKEGGSHLYRVMKEIIEREKLGYKLPYFRAWFTYLPFAKGHAIFNFSHVPRIDATKAEDLTRAEVEARRQIMGAIEVLKRHPAFKDAILVETAPQIGVRETRRVVGEYVLTEKDVMEGREFDDAITSCMFPIDIHPPDDPAGKEGVWGRHPRYDIPYRCLVPLKIENMLVAGRCISATHVAHASLRVQGTCMSIGEAAGVAAALSIKLGVSPRQLDGRLVRKTLVEQGVNIRPPVKEIKGGPQ